ncbi:hypothetical protein Bca52824_028065 [Brassica carinata]|uniref:Uncharacterized protein n=1 Tax=Brassica carinata TaxID=52824 RepID=A0A8X8AP80_BRACI|nr:hypothetical protein Bca52824_028065 [Brassica carinata]
MLRLRVSNFVIFGTNSVCAFALNLAVFLLVGKTSALTMNVAGYGHAVESFPGLKAKDAQKKVQARDEEAGKLLEGRLREGSQCAGLV